jgi:site-specific recombinase XerD
MGFYKINTLVYLCGLVSIYLNLAWLTDEGERLTYWGLNEVIRRRAKAAKVQKPGLHDFRRAFALNFLRNGGDIFTLQRLLGHADLQVLRRYLAQT